MDVNLSDSIFSIRKKPEPQDIPYADNDYLYGKQREIIRNHFSIAYFSGAAYLDYMHGSWGGQFAQNFSVNAYCIPDSGTREYVFELTLSADSGGSFSPFMAFFTGVRVESPLESVANPNQSGKGLYIAFNDQNKASVYFSEHTPWEYPDAITDIPVNFKTPRRLIVRDSGDEIEYCTYEDNHKTRLVLIRFSENTMSFENSEGTVFHSAENTLKSGGYFKVFNHLIRTVISELSLSVTENKIKSVLYTDRFREFETSLTYKMFFFSEKIHRSSLDGVIHEVNHDNIILVSPYTRYANVSNFRYSYCISFKKDLLLKYYSVSYTDYLLSFFGSKVICCPGEIKQRITGVLDQLFALYSAQNANEYSIAVPLLVLLETIQVNGSHVNRIDNKKMAEVVEFIDKWFTEIDDIGQIANKFYYSKFYLCRLFKKYKKETIISYINRKKIEYACVLLSSHGKDLSVTDIGLSCGFNSTSYFCTVFRQFMGVSPAGYRDNNRKTLL